MDQSKGRQTADCAGGWNARMPFVFCAVCRCKPPAEPAHGPSRVRQTSESFGDGCDHVDFAAGAFVAARAAVAEADVVEHRFLGGRLRFFVAGQYGQDDCFAGQAVRVAGVERRAEIRDLIEAADRLGGELRVGVRAKEVAAEAEAEFQFTGGGAFDAGHRVAPGRRRQLDAEMGLQALEDGIFEFRRDADRADTLHVGMAADGHQAAARPADHPAQQGEVGDRLHVFHAVGVLRDAHRPTEDDVFGVRIAQRDVFDFIDCDAALGDDFLPGSRVDPGLPVRAIPGNDR